MRKVLVGMPGYQGLTGHASAGFYNCTADRPNTALRLQTASALLGHNHNLLFVEALNRRRSEGLTHFALQHSDVEPEGGWLDVLLAEMDATGLDVLGVPVPIKDERGLTSTAVDRADGNRWRVSRRLTMTEVFGLPETFTSEHVGGPLLLNTGLLAIRLGDWCEAAWFEVNDRIARDPEGCFVAVVEPEDWNFSRQCHALGATVGCTRKVKLTHRGPVGFPNTHAWGRATDADSIEFNQAEGQT